MWNSDVPGAIRLMMSVCEKDQVFEYWENLHNNIYNRKSFGQYRLVDNCTKHGHDSLAGIIRLIDIGLPCAS